MVHGEFDVVDKLVDDMAGAVAECGLAAVAKFDMSN